MGRLHLYWLMLKSLGNCRFTKVDGLAFTLTFSVPFSVKYQGIIAISLKRQEKTFCVYTALIPPLHFAGLAHYGKATNDLPKQGCNASAHVPHS